MAISLFRVHLSKIWIVLLNISVWLIYIFWKDITNKIGVSVYIVWFFLLFAFITSTAFDLVKAIKIRSINLWCSLYILTLAFVLYEYAFEYIRYDFGWQSRNYKYITQLVESHRLADNPEGGMKLPDGYTHLSENGYISVDQTSGVTRIEFVIDPGLMFSYEAITYISNDDPSKKCISASIGQFKKIEANWYKYKCLDP